MLNNPPDNQPQWKQQLSNFSELPAGASFDQPAAWDKLYNRLKTPGKKKFAAWYWLAAAVVSAILLSVVFMNQKNTVPPVALVQEKKPVVQQDDRLEAVRVTAENKIRFTQTVSKRMAVKTVGVKKIPSAKLPGEIVLPLRAVEAVPQIVGSPPPEDVAASVAVAPAPIVKKKLAIVHLNEIEPEAPQIITSKINSRKNRRMSAKFLEQATEDLFVTKQPDRFTINISSAN
jgi:hypothetical protein